MGFAYKMPRIDPLQLLACIGVLLAPNGGIRSVGEVKRLASLMAKYSKKLVSKCIYIQILKCTETDLLGQFMAAGGWSLAHAWLTDGIYSKNWPLVQELLELLLLCPVDVPRLQSNSAPKLVKGLSREGGNEGVCILATKLVEQWLKIAKGEAMTLATPNSIAASINPIDTNNSNAMNNNNINLNASKEGAIGTLALHTSDASLTSNVHYSASNGGTQNKATTYIDPSTMEQLKHYQPDEDPLDIRNESDEDYTASLETNSKLSPADCKEGLVYKLTIRDGKQVLAKVNEMSQRKSSKVTVVKNVDNDESNDTIDKEKPNTSRINSPMSTSDKKVRSEKENSKSREFRIKDKNKESKEGKSSRDREKDRKSNDSSSQRSSNNKSSKHSSSGGSEKDKEREKVSIPKSNSSTHKLSSSHKSSTSNKSSSHKSTTSASSSREKEKDRYKLSSSSAKSSHSGKDKEKKDGDTKASQADKDKATLAKVLPQSISKIGKIPKKSGNEEVGESTSTHKKSSISIEVRKDAENRPKTVKTFNSQFRSHGLEEAPPPPCRRGFKKSSIGTSPTTVTIINNTSVSGTLPAIKRSLSPTPATKETAEKRIKFESPVIEKPGAIKLIPAKPKPSVLVESDMFMDAIAAATTKKEPTRKRKRLPSGSKDGEYTKDLKDGKDARNSVPMKFYQDTLEEQEMSKDTKPSEDLKNELIVNAVELEDEIVENKIKKVEEGSNVEFVNELKDNHLEKRESSSGEEEKEDERRLPGPGCGPNGPPGVLILHRRKGPKKVLKWRPQESLEEIRLFELDETERVNVTKTFVDMKQMERSSEREAFLTARKLGSEDIMVEQMEWAPLIEVIDVAPIQHGATSKEKEIQADREKTVLKTIYFDRSSIPDSPAEPDLVAFPYVEPQIMPLYDVTGNPDAIHDFTNMPWPESKGSPPPVNMNMTITDIMPFGNFNPFQPFGVQGNNINMGNLQNMGNMSNVNNMSVNNMTNMPIGMAINGPMPPFNPMIGPHDMNSIPQFHGPNGPIGPNFGSNGPPNFMSNFGPSIHMNENNNRGRSGSNWSKNNNANVNWQPPMGGPSSGRLNWLNRDRICKQFQRGNCRHGNRCKFLHPGVNCPPI